MYENVNKKMICVVIKESCICFIDMVNLLKFLFFKKFCFDFKINKNIWNIGLYCLVCYKYVFVVFCRKNEIFNGY